MPKVPLMSKRNLQRSKWRRMSYGYIIDWDVARERGAAIFESGGNTDSVQYRYVKKMNSDCRRFWPRTCLRVVDFDGMIVSCITLAENTSQSAMKLPPQEAIDEMKRVLETKEEPRWYKFYA
jgi:hypothetical protein